MEMPEGWNRAVRKLQEIDTLTGYSPEIMTSDITEAVILMKEMTEVLEELHIESINHDDNSLNSAWIKEQTSKILNKFKEWK